MLFTTLYFWVFAVATFLLFRLLPWNLGRLILLGSSYYFYAMANPWYSFLLFFSTLVDYLAALWLSRKEEPLQRKIALGFSLAVNLGMLGIFKYGDFFIENLNRVIHFSGNSIEPLGWLLPVGISFYTFQTLSYTIDVYRKKAEPTRDFVQFAIYVSFFPQLVAGPIERASKLLPQLAEKKSITSQDMIYGFQRILWGMVKKLVIADQMGIVVNHVYHDPAGAGGALILLGLFSFSFNLYMDFSAYTDIAIGVARLFGVRLSENFDWPYLAENPSEFWSRWHMTLTTWFTDYVFQPMGGLMRAKPVQSFFNIVFLMALIGFWHGAAWNFVIFGILAGLASAGYMSLKLHPRLRGKKLLGNYVWSKPLSILLTYVWTVVVLGIFFRSPDMATVKAMIVGLFDYSIPWDPTYNLHIVLCVLFGLAHIIRGVYFNHRRPVVMHPVLRGFFWAFLVVLLVMGSVKSGDAFIYFQF